MANTPGDYMVRRNDTSTAAIPNTGTLDADWDGAVDSLGTSITYSAGTFTLKSGKYLIAWNEWFNSGSIAARTEEQAALVIGGAETSVACGQQYVENPITACVLGGLGILNIASDSTSLVTRFYNTDTNTPAGGTQPARAPDKGGGVSIVALDDTWAYARYHKNANVEVPSTPAFTLVAFDVNDEQDTGFSNSSGAVTITTAGRYIVCFSIRLRSYSSATNDFMSRITLDDTEVPGTRVTTFLRGANGCRDGCLSYGGIIDVATDDVLKVEVFQDLGSGGGPDILANANLQILKLPSGNKTVIVEATTGDMNPSAETLFAWDTVPHIDTSDFSHTAGDSTIVADTTGIHFFFATQCEIGDGGEEDYPTSKFGLEASTTNSVAAGGGYSRANGGPDVGFSFGALYSLTGTDTIGVYAQSEGFTTNALACDHGAFSAVSLDSIITPPASTRRVFVT